MAFEIRAYSTEIDMWHCGPKSSRGVVLKVLRSSYFRELESPFCF